MDKTNKDLDKAERPTVAKHGIPGFHNKVAQEDGKPLAGMEPDADGDPARVNTGTGDQPGNTKGSRFGTPSSPPVANDERKATDDQ